MTLEELQAQNKALLKENKQFKTTNEELNAELSELKNRNSLNELTNMVEKLIDKIGTLNQNITTLNERNTSALFYGTLSQLKEELEADKAERRETINRLEALEKQLNATKIEVKHVEEAEEKTKAAAKAEIERVNKVIADEKENDVVIAKPQEVEQLTIEEVNKELSYDEEDALEEGFTKVVARNQADDLILSNAVTYIKNKGDKLVVNGINEEEKEKKPELEEPEANIEEQQNTDLSRGDITEVIEEKPSETLTEGTQQVVSREVTQEPSLNEVISPEVANKINYLIDNIKASKMLFDKRKEAVLSFINGKEADISDIPVSRKESFDNNLINMAEVTGQQISRGM